MEELKPCPFCGGKAEIETGVSKMGAYARCYCKKCGARTRESKDVSHNGSFVFDAIRAWNRREEECLQQ